MTRDAILSLVRSCLAKSHGYEDGEWIDEEYPESYDLDDLGMDSLEIVDFILALEQRFQVKIDEEMDSLFMRGTIGEIVDWLMGVVK